MHDGSDRDIIFIPILCYGVVDNESLVIWKILFPTFEQGAKHFLSLKTHLLITGLQQGLDELFVERLTLRTFQQGQIPSGYADANEHFVVAQGLGMGSKGGNQLDKRRRQLWFSGRWLPHIHIQTIAHQFAFELCNSRRVVFWLLYS